MHRLRGCSVYQFHDTSDTSSFKMRWDVEDNNHLRAHGGNLAAVLLRLEREDIRRFELICRHIKTVLAGHLRRHEVEPVGKARGGSGGGNVSVERLTPEMRELYWSFAAPFDALRYRG